MKKGFTLIELLAVIVILALLIIIVSPVINSSINRSKEAAFNEQILTIFKGAYDWSLNNTKILPASNNDSVSIYLGQLKQTGNVVHDIKNPKTGKNFPDDLVINIKYITESDDIDYKYYKKEGNYLFIIDENSLDSNNNLDYKDSPSIVLNGDAYMTLNLNSSIYEEPGYTVLDSNGNIIDETATITITTLDNDIIYPSSVSDIASYIDTSTLGLYYIDYIISLNDKTAKVRRTVSIKDITPPEIEIFADNRISSFVNSFDLLKGVSCTDNSSECTITTKGNLLLGYKGKYVITYMASDIYGNTSSKKRIITIE